MNYKFSRLLVLSILTALLLLPSAISAASITSDEVSTLKSQIPTKMEPGTILKYDKNTKPLITYDTLEIVTSPSASQKASKSASLSSTDEVVDLEGRATENAFFESIAEEAKELGLPIIDLGYDLPDPEPGLVVIYGSDGLINHYYNEFEISNEQSSKSVSPLATIPSRTVPYPGRLAPGVYNYGTNQKITITSGAVTGEGRFTVYRAGVGGSGTVGSSGKTLVVGDVATKRQIDNPRHNTALNARALDTNVVKTVFKNDIGSLPNAVLDIYFWGWGNTMFGHTYSDTLSFPGRYYYQY